MEQKYNESITQKLSSIETLATTNMGAGSINDNLKKIAEGIAKAASGKDVEFADITPATDLKGNITEYRVCNWINCKSIWIPMRQQLDIMMFLAS